jgi:hypothetical protein
MQQATNTPNVDKVQITKHIYINSKGIHFDLKLIMGFLSGMIGGCVGYGCQIFSNATQKVPLSRRT